MLNVNECVNTRVLKLLERRLQVHLVCDCLHAGIDHNFHLEDSPTCRHFGACKYTS